MIYEIKEHLTIDGILESMKYRNISLCALSRLPVKYFNETNDHKKDHASEYSPPSLLDNLQQVACLDISWEDQLPSVIDASDKQGERSAEGTEGVVCEVYF